MTKQIGENALMRYAKGNILGVLRLHPRFLRRSDSAQNDKGESVD